MFLVNAAIVLPLAYIIGSNWFLAYFFPTQFLFLVLPLTAVGLMGGLLHAQIVLGRQP
jgi:hypothetical protein